MVQQQAGRFASPFRVNEDQSPFQMAFKTCFCFQLIHLGQSGRIRPQDE